MHDLSTRAMLVSLSISHWRCRKRDRAVTAEVAAAHATTERAGNYNKHLLPLTESNAYTALAQAAGQAYAHFREHTLPWLDDGARICPAANYMVLADAMRADRAVFHRAVDALRSDLPALVDQARGALNGLFNAADYPSADDVASRCEYTFRVLPLPDAGDFRAELSDDDTAAIRAAIEADTRSATAAAMRDLYDRLHERVTAFAAALAGDGAVRKATLAGLRDILDVVPRLNLTADATLTAAHADLVALLDTVEAYPPVLEREQLHTRAGRTMVKARVADVMDRMAAFMAGGQS